MTAGSAHRWLASVVLAASFAILGLQTLGPTTHSSLGIDEQVSYYIALGRTPDTVFARATQQSATPPLYFWLARCSSQIMGSTPLAEHYPELPLRIPALLFSFGSLYVVYRLGSEMHCRGMGAIASLLLAGHPQFVYHATQARPYALGIFANLLAGWCIYRLSLCRSIRWIVLLILANLNLLWSHYLFAVPVLFQGLLFAMAPRPRDELAGKGMRFFGGSAVAGICLLSMLLLLPAILSLQARGEYLNWVTEYSHWTESLRLLTFVDNDPVDWRTWVPLAAAALSAIAIGFGYRLVTRRRQASDAAKEPAPVRTGWLPISCHELLFLSVWAFGPSFLLWGVSLYQDPALSQNRYFATQIGPTVLVVAWWFVRLGGQNGGLVAAVALLSLNGLPQHVAQVVRHPVRHDRFWQNAALTLNEQAKPGDLVLVQSGLIETKLVPLQFADAGFQEYTTSRLSDFYLHAHVRKLSLPLIWPQAGGPPADWQVAYTSEVKKACEEGHRVWIVLSADSDIGEHSEANARHWLRALGFRVRTVDDNRVARILVVDCENG